MPNYGDTPHILYGQQDNFKALFYSNEEAALTVPVSFQAGYGILKMGTAVALNKSNLTTGGKDLMLPYAPTTFTGAEVDPARAYLVASSGTTDKYVYVTMDDSYKFQVGDDVCLNDNTTAVEDKGVITAIDRASERHRAKITFTAAIGGTAYTPARDAYLIVQGAAANSNNFSDCVGILMKSIDTGIGEHAQGADAELILGNCVLYTGALTNFDAAAITDVSAGSFGRFTYIR